MLKFQEEVCQIGVNPGNKGMTPHQFCIQNRIRKSQGLLDEEKTIVAINIIAALTGSSATSLQLFLKHFLISLRHCLILLKIYIELWQLLRADWILCHMRQG